MFYNNSNVIFVFFVIKRMKNEIKKNVWLLK